MSRRKDGGFPRRKHGNCNKPLRSSEKETTNETIRPSARPSQPVAGPSRADDRPPPDLKGKALGLWYRDRQTKKNKTIDDERLPEIKLPRDRFEEIEQLLFDVSKANRDTDDKTEGDFKIAFRLKNEETFQDKMSRNFIGSETKAGSSLDEELSRRLSNKMKNDTKYQEMLEFRSKLPCFKKKQKLIDVIAANQVVVISGETGCGKTTQVAQYVLDDEILHERGSHCNIICTQPRRISAISVAERVAAERNENLGASVGYQIRLEKVLPSQRNASLTFVTTGILLQYIQGDPTLRGTSHLFLDEVHERDILCDFVLACLKQIIVKRPDLKVILMSATLNAERFASYFGAVDGDSVIPAPCIHIPGFTFPVDELYLDEIIQKTGFKFQIDRRQMPFKRGRNQKNDADFEHVIVPYIREMEATGFISRSTANELYNPASEKVNVELIQCVILHISVNEPDGAILVFVPGLIEISNIHKGLMSKSFFNNDNFVIVPLHSTLPTINQRKVFNRPPKGVRKIIIATNIAETSITIDDVVYVVDCGYIKMTNFNMELNVSTLDYQWVSQANARQRRGRAGRVKAGKCYKLYTSAREALFEAYPLPEIQRTRLEEVVLQVKTLQLGKAAPFLLTVLDPPDSMAVVMSLNMLRRLNALDENEALTPLGFHLAKLPMDPQTGKMILMAAFFSCVEPVLSIAAALSFKDPFHTPLGKEHAVHRTKERLADGQRSDHLLLWLAMSKWEEAVRQRSGRSFAYDNFLSENTLYLLKDMKGQFARHLHDMNFLGTADPKDASGNINSRNIELVKAIVCAGLYPNVAMIKKAMKRGEHSKVILKTADHIRVELHPRSVCSKESQFTSPLFVYHLMMKSSSIFVHDVTMVSPWALLFFGEKLEIVEFNNTHAIRVDSLAKFNCFKKTGMLIQKLRKQLDLILEKSISNPGVIDWSRDSSTTVVLKAIVKLITADNDEMMMMQLEEWE